MSILDEIRLALLLLVFFFSFIRGVFYTMKRYKLSKSEYKTLKKENFKEWFFCLGYKKKIPLTCLVLYYTILIIHPLCICACVFFEFVIILSFDIGKVIITSLVLIDFTCIIIPAVLLNFPPNVCAYECWLNKQKEKEKEHEKEENTNEAF